MSDRRAVSAGHVMSGGGASSVATDTWRVAVGGNRVESMTVDQIAQAFHSGHLNARTPLWPPGSTGWQALGNFEQFQMHPAAYAGAAALSQFEEADDDPTRMWTGGPELDMPGDYAAANNSAANNSAANNYNYAPNQAPAYEAREPRPSARTGTRPISRPAPLPPPSIPRPAPTASLPPSRAASAVPMSIPPFRRGRNNGLMLVAGLVGLVGLGSAVLAARGNLGGSSPDAAAATAAEAKEASAAGPEAATTARAAGDAPTEAGQAALAKYEDSPSPAAPGVAPTEAAQAPTAAEPAAEPKLEIQRVSDLKDQADDAAEEPQKASSAPAKVKDEPPAKKASGRTTPKRAAPKAKSLALARVERAEKAERVEKLEKPEKVEKVEKAEVASEPAKAAAPASASVNEAAAAALANSANLASSCRPRGGPAGAGKARVIYSNDGEVQSVEILTAKFRDTLTGSCVRMVFRRAKIPAFKGEPPSFIKTFTIPEE